MNLTPKQELDKRINKLQQLMAARNIEAVIITQSIDLFYFTGTSQNSHLFVPVQGAPLLMTRRVLERAIKESALEKIIPMENVKLLPELIKSEGYPFPKTIGLELDVMPANNYFFYQKILAPAQLVDAAPLIREVRSVKSPFEIELLKESAALNDEVYRAIPDILREGITEVEASAELERIGRQKGHQGFMRMRAFNQEIFFGLLIAGVNGGMPSFFDGPMGGMGVNPSFPQGAGFKKIKAGEPILIDYGGIKDGYIIDQTRIYAINFLPEKLVKAHEIAIEIQNKIVKFIKVGETSCDEVYEYSLELAKEAGYGDYFMGYKELQVKFVGHGIGLELDEQPVLARGFKQKILPGMVLAIEPKFAFPGQGGVGIENTWVAGEKELERLTLASDDLMIIEK